ncbi:VOC family protein [Enterovibrio coralii]|uniref:VOC family protein n=1 Tax=Enterovibrio coralii TaxID=294935 RepID=UPI000A550960|nr:VOC family protein [Enterovibrio coralii]
MSKLQPHITFHGLCREALSFYKQAFDGEIVTLQTFNDSPVEFQQHILDRVMHAEFVSREVSFLASDGSMTRSLKVQETLHFTLALTMKKDRVRCLSRSLNKGK